MSVNMTGRWHRPPDFKPHNFKHDRVGEIGYSEQYGEYVVVEYRSYSSLDIMFKRTGTIQEICWKRFLSSGVMDREQPHIYSVGFIDLDYKNLENGRFIHNMWKNMLKRCYSEKELLIRPAYKGVTVCEDWLRFSIFYKDVTNKKGFEYALSDKWQLDKDILSNKNVMYSNSTTCFVPQEINKSLESQPIKENGLPQGVKFSSKSKKSYRVSVYSKRFGKYEETFLNLTDAEIAYKDRKNSNIRGLALFYKDSLDELVFNYLMAYKY